MGKPPRKSRQRLDKTNEALLGLTDILLDDIFFDPEIEEKLRKAQRAKRGPPRRIDILDIPGGGQVVITAEPGTGALTIRMTHATFEAEIAATYDLDEATMAEARVVSFDGDHAKARKLAEDWADEIDDFDLDEDLGADLMQLLETVLPDDEETDEPEVGEDQPPPPPTAEDAAFVRAVAARLMREMKRREPNLMSLSDDMMALEANPQSLWPILDGLIEACLSPRRDVNALEAWRLLFLSQLTAIRYRIDRGWSWARAMADDCIDRLIAIGKEGRVAPEDFTAIIGAFGEARIEMSDAAKKTLASAGMEMPDDVSTESMHAAMGALLDQMAEAVTDPFDVREGLGDSMRAMPSEIRSFMAHEFAHSKHLVLRDTVPLLLLAEDQEVRRSATAALEQTATPETMSPQTLRRMIAIRNWLPHADRPALDQAIRKARLKGVACAQWPAPAALEVLASVVDGSGAISIVVATKGRGKGTIGGTLLRQSAGVVDSWCHTDMTRAEINRMLAKVRDSIDATTVDPAFMDRILQHIIAIGAANGEPPGVGLLRIAEFAGGSDWQDRHLDVATESASLLDHLPPALVSPQAITASLQRSGEWMGQHGFTESWFLDDAKARTILRDARKRKSADAVDRLLAEVLPPQRAIWAERFLIMALRARASHHAPDKAMIAEFSILAHVLCGDTPLADIPLMREIAEHSVMVGNLRPS